MLFQTRQVFGRRNRSRFNGMERAKSPRTPPRRARCRCRCRQRRLRRRTRLERGRSNRLLRFERAGNDARLKLANFRHDILIAASRRSIGATLVTYNGNDFDAIQDVNGFPYITPFP